MHPLGTDMKKICGEDPLSRIDPDILGVGCTIHSIAAWQVFYYDCYERWPVPSDLPSTSGLLF